MDTLTDISGQLQLRPAELPSRFDVPCPLLGSQLRLQNDHVLCPADGHGLTQHFRCALIGAVELPHPAQVPGGEARGVRVCAAQILRSGDSGAFLWPAADQPAKRDHDECSLDGTPGFEADVTYPPLTPEEIMELAEDRAALYAALDRLPPVQARRVYAHYILGRSKTGIARAENVTENAVRDSISRGVETLKILLGNLR